jgi:DNA-binding CsgD family transcriptional regulator
MEFITDHSLRFIEDLERVKSEDELVAFIRATLYRLGLRYFSYYEPAKTRGTEIRGINIHNVPQEWLQRYLEQGYDAVNPVICKINRTRSPFFWNTLRSEGYFDSKQTRRMWSEGSEFGLGDGFTFPIFHTNGDMVLFNLACDRLEDDPRLPPAILLISIYLHEKFKALRGLNRAEHIPDLTNRECECLAWAGAGKTNWEIGEILSISEATVRTYFKRAKHKLGVTTKIQAIVSAARHRLIRL